MVWPQGGQPLPTRGAGRGGGICGLDRHSAALCQTPLHPPLPGSRVCSNLWCREVENWESPCIKQLLVGFNTAAYVCQVGPQQQWSLAGSRGHSTGVDPKIFELKPSCQEGGGSHLTHHCHVCLSKRQGWPHGSRRRGWV